MKDVMLADTPLEERAQILRDSCDKIVEKCYTRKFDTKETSEKRAELANVSIQIADLEERLAEIRADYKGRIKPLIERLGKIRGELKAGGEWVSGECYQFLDAEEGKAALYDPSGYKIEERDLRPEERTRTIFQGIRENMTVQMSKTGTDN
nr:MAG: hypothetical protein [Bacteriophage sp.]